MVRQYFLKSLVIIASFIPLKLFAQNQDVFAVCQNHATEQESTQNELLELQKQLQKSPRSHQIHYEMGLAYQKLNQIEQAKKSFYQALAWSDDAQFNSKILYNVGNLNVCKQNFDEAIVSYRQALKQSPDDFDTQYNLALAHFMKNQQNQDNQQNENQEEQAQNSQNQNQNQDNPQSQEEQEASEESDQNVAQNSEQSESDDEQKPFSLSQLQLEQALNSVQENRQGFVRRMLQQQLGEQAVPEKNW